MAITFEEFQRRALKGRMALPDAQRKKIAINAAKARWKPRQRKAIQPIGRRGKYPTWLAKVGSGPSDIVLIKSLRRFAVGDRVLFEQTSRLDGMSVGIAPRWRTGKIDHIDEFTGMLFIAIL